MGKIYQCVGRIATQPYVFRATMIKVYCIEELCFYMVQNADLLDESFACMELVNWINDELALPELAKKLKEVLRISMKTESFVRAILEELCYVDEQKMKEMERVIRAGRLLPKKQRGKALADYFLNNRHYAMALKAYEDWLEHNRDDNDGETAEVYKCMGVVYARLFYFAEAAELFDRAYGISGDPEIFTLFLLAKRMELGDAEYLKFVTGLPEGQPGPVEAESMIEKALEEYKKSEELKRMNELEDFRRDSKRVEFDGAADWYTESEIDAYRDCMIE